MADRKKKIKKNEIALKADIDPTPLLPVIQNLSSMGYSIADLGMILGFSGKDAQGWLYRLQEKHPDVKTAIEVGKNLADLELIKTAFKEATGYWIEEEETTYKRIPKPDDWTETKWISVGKKKKPKYIPPNTKLLFQLLCSRMPEYFSDTKKIEVNKQSIEIKAQTEEEIRSFAGKLLKVIDSEVIDVDVDGSSTG